ncbi:MAG: multicopper oxidase domain-containing protein [Actinophytocola sp.]|nr:multicopper oxidase domain-containing protein [Actinophytocola sp.]
MTARIYDFGLSDDRELTMIASDGGLLDKPHRTDRVRLSPGERAEVIVEMTPGEELTLRSFGPDLGASSSNTRDSGGDDQFDVLQLRAKEKLTPSPPLPDRLVTIPRLDPADAAQKRSFELRSRRINGEKMDLGRIDTVVTKDTTEVWQVRNDHGRAHNFHIHDVRFQVLTIDGAAPPPELRGWKDTIYLPPRVPIRLIMRFTGYADPATPYMYHCHLLRHEDEGMMGQFVVVEPGQRPVAPSDDHGQ